MNRIPPRGLRCAVATLSGSALLLSAATAASASVGTWDTHYDDRTSGPINVKSKTIGEYRYRVKVFKLEEASDTKDYYRVDQSLEIAAKKKHYKKTNSRCGWASHRVVLAIDVDGRNVVVDDYGPETSKGGRSYSKRVGAALGSSGPSLDAGYSMTTTVPDEGVKTDRGIAAETVLWTARLRGCKDVGNPFGSEHASGLARSAYKLETTAVIEVDEGQSFVWKNAVGKKSATVSMRRWRFVNLKEKTDTVSRALTYSFSCSPTRCRRR